MEEGVTMSYFQDAEVKFEGRTFRFSADEGDALEDPANYWHGPGAPSSWLAVTMFLEALEKAQGAPVSVALELAARVLGITVEHLRSTIEWHEQYMRWHDGDPDYKVL
jgi:hypothetical protein